MNGLGRTEVPPPATKLKEEGDTPTQNAVQNDSLQTPDYRHHRVPGQYSYRPGLDFPHFVDRDYLDNAVRNMEMKASDVLIAAYPKTGNTWMQELLWLVMNDADVTGANASLTNDRVPFLEYWVTDHINGVKWIEEVKLGGPDSCRILYTHLPMDLVPRQVEEKKVKVISLLRNPLDTMVSYFYFCKSYNMMGHYQGSWQDFFYWYSNETVPYGHVVEHNLSWWKARDSLNVLFVRFEDLLKDPREEIRKIAKFCNKDLTEEQIETIAKATDFEVMKSNPMTNRIAYKDIDQSISPFMRKGISGDWQNHFSKEEYSETVKATLEKISGSGLTYPYCD